ncbi:hypothetical protein NVP1029O_44 [Vibrio phage 1.029.O._10N.261.55.A7]|nr:hypothetical protein NVP1029O_44 [Vibrio phage 1.029.O._10N.261.55.A7]
MDLNFIADKVTVMGVNVEIQGVDIEQVIHAVGVNELIEGLIHKLGDKALIDAIIEQSGEGRN